MGETLLYHPREPKHLMVEPAPIEYPTVTVNISELSPADLLSLLGPDGISINEPGEGRVTRYKVPGVVGIDVSSEVPAGTIDVWCVDQKAGDELQEWLEGHFKRVNEERARSNEQLRAHMLGRRAI